MGFYGNITNMARTSFTFDKTYPNRYAMEQAAENDEVFIGRYVLVDYDTENNDQSTFTISYKWIDEESGALFFGQSFPSSSPTGAYRWNSLEEGKVIVVPFTGDYNQAEPDATTNQYWKCTGTDEQGYNVFEAITDSTNSYTQNYNIDTAEYGNGRGYDSTAWQKVSVNGVTKYVMVAELNSVVPSFGITADAPTMTPLRPHWGKDSTNVYYDLHWQVPWGLRIKSAIAGLQIPTLDDYGADAGSYVDGSSDVKEYPSDELVVWTKQEGNAENNYSTHYANYNSGSKSISWNSTSSVVGQPAAIYYNKAGFKPEVSTYSTDKKYNGWQEGLIEDKITMEPTGHSGYGYNGHDSANMTKQYDEPDSMELSVMLPSLGDSVAHMWDLVYGDRAANNNNTSNSRNMDIGWENARYEVARKGLRLIPNNENAYRAPEGANSRYRTDQVNTIAGAINSVHDLMGMIITPEETLETLVQNIDDLSEDRIYYANDSADFYRKKTGYSYIEADQAWVYGDDFFNDKDENGVNKGHEGSIYGYELVENLTAKNFDPLVYYEKVNDEYVPVDSNETFIEGKEYYGRYIIAPAEPYQKCENVLNWEPDKYWYEDYIGSSYYATNEFKQDFIQSQSYEYGKTYYKDLVVEDAGDLSPEVYEPDKYWYWNNVAGAYQRDPNDEVTVGRQYYKLNKDYIVPVTGSDGIYVPGIYYRETSPGSYKLCNEESLSSYSNLYMAVENAETIDNKIYIRSYIYERVSAETAEENYRPGFYYILSNQEDKNSEIIDTEAYRLDESHFIKDQETKTLEDGEIVNNTYDSQQIYFVLNETLTRTEDLSKIIDTTHSLNLIPYTIDTFFRYSIINGVESYRPVARAEIKAGQAGLANLVAFWTITSQNSKNTDERSNIQSPINNHFDWYRNLVYTGLVDDIYSYPDYALRKQDDFFTKGLYHKKIKNNFASDYSDASQVNGYDYIFDATPNQDTGASYVTVKNGTKLDKNISFYYPYHFYEKIGEYYRLLTSETVPVDGNGDPIEIYKKYCYYIDNDASGIHQHGEEWNPNIRYIPSTITLAVRHEYNVLEGIPGFARDFSTMHGLLLRLLRTLEFNDSEIRDTRTVRGMLNTLNDILTKIHTLQPNNAVYINDYGQISSAPIETNKWIDVTVNSRVKDPSIVINHHGIIAADNTTSNSDVNNSGDTIQLYTPIIDEAGHVVGNNTETVTLPYGFKHIDGSNSDVVTDAPSAIATQAAESTQDTINFVGSNKWIKANVAADDTVKFGHLVQNIDTVAASATDLNDGTDTITIQDITNDEAGHIRSNKSHEYTLPFGYKTVKVGEDDLVAENTQDDIEIIAGDAWVELAGSANAHTITATHASAQATAASIDVNSGNATPAFGATFNIPTFGFDAKGHYKESASTTVTIPALSLTNGAGNVVTGLTLTPSTGALVEAKENIGNIALGTYTSLLSTPEISASDSIGSAISKLEKDLKDEVAERERAEAAEVDARSEADEDLSQAIADEVTARTNAIEALDLTEVSAGAGQVIGAVSQTNGLVSATVKTLAASDIPNIELNQVVDTDNNTDLPTMLSDLFAGNIIAGSYERTNTDPITGETTIETVDVKYNELYDLIAALSNQINDLKARVETLENSAPESQTEP